MAPDRVLLTVNPVFEPLLLVGGDSVVDNSAARWRSDGLSVWVLRGSRMTTLDALFEEFAAALQFPLYFGHNKDAFNDCITDMSWAERHRGLVLVVAEADSLLRDEDEATLGWFVGALAHAAGWWSTPISDGEVWDREPTPFHIVVADHADVVDAVDARWKSSGAELSLELNPRQPGAT